MLLDLTGSRFQVNYERFVQILTSRLEVKRCVSNEVKDLCGKSTKFFEILRIDENIVDVYCNSAPKTSLKISFRGKTVGAFQSPSHTTSDSYMPYSSTELNGCEVFIAFSNTQ